MMDLSNPVLQFIVNNIVTIILFLAGICFTLATRRTATTALSAGCETLEIKRIENIEEVDEMKKKMLLSSDADTLLNPCLVILKIWNRDKYIDIELPETAKPLTIEFFSPAEAKVMGLDIVEKVPNAIEVIPKIDAEKILLWTPLLKPKESIILKVLVSHDVNYRPYADVRIPNKVRIMVANNVKLANEDKIAAIVYLCVSLLFPLLMFSLFGFFSYGPNPEARFMFASINICLLLASISFMLSSRMFKKMRPYPFMLHSTLLSLFFKGFLQTLPELVVIGTLGILIYRVFGGNVLRLSFFVFVYLLIFCSCWRSFYVILTNQLRKRNKAYNNMRIVMLTGILPVAFIAYSTWVLFLLING